jgi:hypothetical protein
MSQERVHGEGKWIAEQKHRRQTRVGVRQTVRPADQAMSLCRLLYFQMKRLQARSFRKLREPQAEGGGSFYLLVVADNRFTRAAQEATGAKFSSDRRRDRLGGLDVVRGKKQECEIRPGPEPVERLRTNLVNRLIRLGDDG